MSVYKIISGGQTGVDQAGLRAGKKLGLETGGWMPLGFKTQSGPRRDFEALYGMRQHTSPNYPPRTLANVNDADGTLIMGNSNSPGCRLTIKYCEQLRKPYCLVPRTVQQDGETIVRLWVNKVQPRVLNVAGNREESSPGIGKWAMNILCAALAEGRTP